MKQYTLGQHTLDEFADFLNGQNNYFEGIEGCELIVEGEHHLTKTINMNIPLTITGKNAVIIGNKSDDFMFSMTSSNTSVQNFEMKNVRFAIEIDGKGKCVENTHVKGITLHEGLRLVDIGSTVSNSTLKNIRVEDCVSFVAYEDYSNSDSENGEMALSYNICCARHAGGGVLENCLLEGVVLNNCKKIGNSTAGIAVVTGMPLGTNYAVMDKFYSSLVVRNIDITNNFIDTCWDCNLVVIGAFINTGAGLIENINIEGNHCKYGIGAIGISAGNHHIGDRGHSLVRNVKINNNLVERGIEDVGEPSWAIWAYGCRDYVPGTRTHDHTVENVEIAYNKVKGAGICLKGCYVLLDIPAVQMNNKVQNAHIHHNEITDADNAFEFYGIDIHGRLYDWNYGSPRHDQKWGEEIQNHDVVNAVAIGNQLVDIKVTDNKIEGYRYRVRACGARAHGHGVCINNKVTENIIFERNEFGVGENHIQVAGFACDDYVRDGGGNEVSDVFKRG